MDSFRFESDLARASTIPSAWYFDPAILQQENERIFARSWQLVGRADQVAMPGNYFTAEVAGEPLLVVRDREGELRALSNVCRHRAGPVASGSGTRASFQCGYHGWTWSLEGGLLTTPEFEGVEDFDRTHCALPQFEVAVWGPLVFVRVTAEGPALAEVFDGIDPSIGGRDLSEFKWIHRKDWWIDCNWKVYVDNYLEGYHIPIVHPGLFRELDYANYRTETFAHYSIQHSPIRKPDRLRVREGSDQARYFWIFPNLMLNVYPDNFSTNLIIPAGPGRTLTIFEWYFADPDTAAARRMLEETVGFSDEIQLEDVGICEAVQRGLRSRTYDQGRYSVRRENGVHHFHQLLSRGLKPMNAQ